MPKRKSAPCSSSSRAPLSLASLDAALDLLACDTFTRLDGIKTKFESAAGFEMDDSAVRARWDDAVKRYWVMKSMDDLCCGSKPMAKDGAGSGSGAVKGKGKEREQGWEDEQMDQDGQHGQGKEEGERERERVDEHGRAIVKPHPGAVTLHGLNAEEEHEWRKWTPRLGDVVLVDTPSEGVWPGKIIDKKVYFIGRTQPKGNHFFAVRIYNPNMEPYVFYAHTSYKLLLDILPSRTYPGEVRQTPSQSRRCYRKLLVPPDLQPEDIALPAYLLHLIARLTLSTLTIKSRLIPFHLRPIGPLLAPDPLLSAYNHAASPDAFDLAAGEREYAQADRRAHPGTMDVTAIKQVKADWNGFVNWVMNERRAEKLRNLAEERERRLRMMASAECREYTGVGTAGADGSRENQARANGANGSADSGTGAGRGAAQQKYRHDGQGPAAFSSPARPSGRETEMTDMTDRPRGGIDLDIDLDADPANVQGGKRQRRSSMPLPPDSLLISRVGGMDISGSGSSRPTYSSSTSLSAASASTSTSSGLGIFNVPSTSLALTSSSSTTSTPRRTSSPFRLRPGMGSMSAILSTPTRPLSPRRLEKRRGSGIMGAAPPVGMNGYESPRRGSWTPPRILPSGDETAPFKRFSGVGLGGGVGGDGENEGLWNRQFDFVSPLGPVRGGLMGLNGDAEGMRARTMSPLAPASANSNSNAGTGGHGYANGNGNGDSNMDGADNNDSSQSTQRSTNGPNGQGGPDTPYAPRLTLSADHFDASDISTDTDRGPMRRKSECLEMVKEEDEEGDWTLVGSGGKSIPSSVLGAKMNGSGRYGNDRRDRAGSEPAPSPMSMGSAGTEMPVTPIGKGKSSMHAKDRRERELMMTPTKASGGGGVGGGQRSGMSMVGDRDGMDGGERRDGGMVGEDGDVEL